MRHSPVEVAVDLFEANRRATLEQAAPLSARMRPRSLAEIVGHEEVIGEGTLLRQAIERDQLVSLVLWGPPGSRSSAPSCARRRIGSACIASVQSCSLTKFTASTKPSKMQFCPSSKRA